MKGSKCGCTMAHVIISRILS